jgi:hypothetical protein
MPRLELRHHQRFLDAGDFPARKWPQAQPARPGACRRSKTVDAGAKLISGLERSDRNERN